MRTVEVHSVSEYVELVCGLNNKIKNADGNDALLFRGQPDKENELVPSLGRKGAKGKAFLHEESNMVKMAKYKLPTVFRRELEPIELLALLQHHGIPTRLLDVSENALVGLYFACHGTVDNVKDDGEVVVFKCTDIEVANYSMVNMICDSYRNAKKYGTEDLKRLYWFCKEPIFVYAPSYSLRQNIQSGRYILFANKIECNGEEYKMTNEIEPISKENDSIICRVIIPAEVKKFVRRDLRLLGVSKELLFLDNVDMVCKEIRDRFER